MSEKKITDFSRACNPELDAKLKLREEISMEFLSTLQVYDPFKREREMFKKLQEENEQGLPSDHSTVRSS